MHRARARPMPPSSIARSRARMLSDVFVARRLVLLLVVVARPSSVDVDRVLARALARLPRAPPAGRRTTTTPTTTIDRSIERAEPADVIFLSAHPPRARSTRPSRARAHPHPSSTRARARSVGRPWRGSNRDRTHLSFLGRLRGARDDDGTGASSGFRGRVDRARVSRVRDRSSRREHRRLLPPSRARGRATGDARDGRGGPIVMHTDGLSVVYTMWVCLYCVRDGLSWCLTMGSLYLVYPRPARRGNVGKNVMIRERARRVRRARVSTVTRTRDDARTVVGVLLTSLRASRR